MPGFLTHWYILIETSKRCQDATSGLQSLIMDATALRRRAHGWVSPPETPPAGAVWNTDPLPDIDFRFPGSDLSSMAFLGALAPDLSLDQHSFFRKKHFHRQEANQLAPTSIDSKTPWSDILHRKHSGHLLLTYLELITEIPSPALRSQALAFALGYVSHIATDLAFNPWINALAAAYAGQHPRSHNLQAEIELRLDEHIAEEYYQRPLYQGLQQPWSQYITPALQSLTTTDSLSRPILYQLTAALEATYGLSEEQGQLFLESYLMNMRKWRNHLAGWGRFAFPVGLRYASIKRAGDDLLRITASGVEEQKATTLEQVYAYAMRLSEHFCRLAISYYAALRKPETSAGTRSQLRASLEHNLRNWDLKTGYTLEVTADEEITLRFLHNWIQFANLWQNENEAERVQ